MRALDEPQKAAHSRSSAAAPPGGVGGWNRWYSSSAWSNGQTVKQMGSKRKSGQTKEEPPGAAGGWTSGTPAMPGQTLKMVKQMGRKMMEERSKMGWAVK